MRLIQEIGFSLMLIIGVSMILYDVLLSRARTCRPHARPARR